MSDCSTQCIRRGRCGGSNRIRCRRRLSRRSWTLRSAPSAGNSQHWGFVVVRDPEVRRQLGLIYRKGSDIAKAIYQARGRPAHLTEEQYQRMMSSGAYLWEHMGDAPVLLVPCLRDRPPPSREVLPAAVQAIYEQELLYTDRIRGASIYPAVQNIVL